jgi:hypothetical protein
MPTASAVQPLKKDPVMNMPHNAFKAALNNRATQYGIWAGFATSYAAEIVATPVTTGC